MRRRRQNRPWTAGNPAGTPSRLRQSVLLPPLAPTLPSPRLARGLLYSYRARTADAAAVPRRSFDRLGGSARGEEWRRLRRLRRSPPRFRLDPEMRHVSCVTLSLECGIETVFLEAGAVCAVAAIGLCLDQAADPGRGVGVQRFAEMLVERRHGADGVPDQIQVMHMKDRLREALLPRRGDHQFGGRQ